MPNPPDSPRLELQPENGTHMRYVLEGRVIKNGDVLETWTPLGWMQGEFQWSETGNRTT